LRATQYGAKEWQVSCELSQRKPMTVSITLCRASRVPVQAKSLRPQALYFLIESVHFLSASRVLGFRRIGGAQFFQRLLDGEFGCFGHGKPHIQGGKRSNNKQPRQSKAGQHRLQK
jgi:hypothetical protein